MSAFFRDAQHHLTIDGVPLDRLMTEFGSPLYVYSGAGLQRAFSAFQTAVAPVSGKLHFALKANSALGVIALLARFGAGADIVSAGELARALAAGIAAGDIVFSGVGKSAADIRAALTAGIGQINAESAAEVAQISAVAAAMGVVAPVALRVNVDVDAGHPRKNFNRSARHQIWHFHQPTRGRNTLCRACRRPPYQTDGAGCPYWFANL